MGRRIGLMAALIWAIAGPQLAWAEALGAISPTLPYLDVVHEGRKLRIQRRLDPRGGPAGDSMALAGACPPACVQPQLAAPGIETVAELELLEFVRSEVANGRGVLVDARLPERYRLETLPTAMNIPFSVIKPDNPHMGRILVALGARKLGAEWDFSSARDVLIFGSGPLSDEASKSISVMRGLGFPAGKIRYYRGGLQAWRASGLTTVVPLGTR